MKFKILLFISLAILSLTIHSCNRQKKTVEVNTTSDGAKQEKVLILDVRTIEEWNNDGHAECAINIPIDQLESNLESIKTYDKLVIVCRSGNRAGKAKDMLESKGFQNIENAGAWQNIECK